MARLWTAGAETKDATIESATLSGTAPTYDTTTVRSGSVAWKCSPIGGQTSFISHTTTEANGTTYYLRAYIRVTDFTNLNTNNVNVLGSSTTYNAGIIRSGIGPNGVIRPRFGTTNLGGGVSAALTAGVWYRVEMTWKIGTGALDNMNLYVDGVFVGGETNANRTDTVGTSVTVGPSSAVDGAVDVYLDDIALNDDTGSAQTSLPGAAGCVLLLPTADSAVGTGWTLGTGTAISSNGFGSVDNTPPTGVADLAVGSDPKQIRNATANANTNYDATMTTYTAAGVGAGATVNVVDPIVATAAPVTTSSKQGTVGVASNPAITNIALAAGGTSGAFWSGTAAGTYPTGWKISHGTVTYVPAVTLGTAPVMRITQVTSSTRIAMVCFMGIYVDYTPATSLVLNERQRSRRSLSRTRV